MTAAPACQESRFEPEFGSDRPHLGNTGLVPDGDRSYIGYPPATIAIIVATRCWIVQIAVVHIDATAFEARSHGTDCLTRIRFRPTSFNDAVVALKRTQGKGRCVSGNGDTADGCMMILLFIRTSCRWEKPEVLCSAQ